MCKAERCINACSITPKKSSVFSFWGCPQQTIIMMQTNDVVVVTSICTLAACPLKHVVHKYIEYNALGDFSVIISWFSV